MSYVFVLLAACFLIWLEVGFIRSWSNSFSMYTPPLISVLAMLFLLGSSLSLRRRLAFAFRINAVAATIIVTMALLFLVEIIPIAQGNNDSGEVFWFIVLPAIGISVFAYRSQLRSKPPAFTR